MNGKETYLNFLSEFGFSESDVLAMWDADKIPKEKRGISLGVLFKTYINRNKLKLSSFEKKYTESLFEGVLNNPNSNILFSRLLGELQNEFVKIGLKIPENLYAGVFPTNSFNAQCVKKEAFYLILIDTGCIEIIEAVIQAYFSEIDSSKKEEFIEKTIIDYCQNYKIPKITSSTFPRNDSMHHKVTIATTKFANSFMLSHEIAHVSLKHLDDNKASMFYTIPHTQKKVGVFKKEHAEEFEADIWAAYHLIKRAEFFGKTNSIYVELSILANVICLSLAALIEENFKSNGVLIDSHPTTTHRIYNLQFLYQIMGHDDNLDYYIKYLDFFENLYRKMYNKELNIPFVDKALNKQLIRTIEKLELPITIPEFLRNFS